MNNLYRKYDLLIDYIRNLGSVAVAFSGGVDSSFLLKAARDAVGEKSSAVICRLSSFQSTEYEQAVRFCNDSNISCTALNINELEDDEFCKNPPDRCYICKKRIFGKIKDFAVSSGLSYVIEGTNADDVNDYRPGMRALAELEIKSPLREIGFTKDEIRILSKEFGLPTWNKPSLACLSTRIPYGDRITEQKLRMVENAENYLYEMGFSQLRVRVHGNTARIEIPPDDFMKIINDRIVVTEKLRQMGFLYVTLDLLGFRSGSLNETLNQKP